MSWSKETENIVEFAILAIFGFGIALYLGSVLLQALSSGNTPIYSNGVIVGWHNTTAYNATHAIIGGFGSAIQQVLVPVISIIFVLFLYLVVKHSGILGKKRED